MTPLHEILDFQARQHPENEFAVFGGTRLTYSEAARAVNRIANAFVASGVERGDRVAILAKNCIEYPLLYFGASKAGVVPVPLNYRLAPPEWVWIVNDARARLLISQPGFDAALADVAGELGSVRERVVLGASTGGTDGGSGLPWDRWIGDAPDQPPAREVSADDDAYQMYTSGTTGRPKGAILTHRAVVSNLLQSMFSLTSAPGERALIVAPLYHAAAAIMTLNTVCFAGSLFIQEDFVPADAVRAIDEERIVRALLVPAMIQACLVMVPDVAERRYEHLRLTVYGASPISEHTLRRAIEVFGCDFIQGYGMTETTAVLTYLMPEDHRRALAGKPELLLSCGRPMFGTEVRVVDADDRSLPVGEVGEIIGRGPQLMRGYWNREEASAEALRGGWMHTGDAGRFDAEGFLYIQDRVKDMIVSGGENVYPREIEEVLFQHPAVADAAVIGVPDESWGETVKAIVVLRSGAVASADEIIDFCRGRLGGFKRPRSVDFVDALPRNPSGKVLKRELREPYWSGHARRVS